jgi:hypothetical protein
MVNCKTGEKVSMAYYQGSLIKFAWQDEQNYQQPVRTASPGWDTNWQIIHTITVLTFCKHNIATPNILKFRDIHVYFVYCHE